MGKKRKQEESGPAPTTSIHYDDLPDDQRFTWFLNDQTDALYQYTELIRWIREVATRDGTSYDGLRSICCLRGYPLMEIKVVYREKSASFLISRASLYILAFFCPSFLWRAYDDKELKILGEGFQQLEMTAEYTYRPWRYMGPKEVIRALGNIDSEDIPKASRACEVFMVHICEAARFRFIEVIVQKTLIPKSSTWGGDVPNDQLTIDQNSSSDITQHLTQPLPDLNLSVKTPKEVREFIRKFKQISRAWISYVISDKKKCVLDRGTATECGLINTTVLGRSLGVLCNINLEKLRDKI